MKKYLLILICALLLTAAHAEGDIYFTNSVDRYYHLDENCDRFPDMQLETEHQTIHPYQREIYQKYPISENGALEFGKTACPVCLDGFEPIYLGNEYPEWNHDFEPWAFGDMKDAEILQNFLPAQTPEFREQYDETVLRLLEADKWIADVHDWGTGSPYPDSYIGRENNNMHTATFYLISPDPEIIEELGQNFNCIWIAPGKYAFNEMYDYWFASKAKLAAWQEANNWNIEVGMQYMFLPDQSAMFMGFYGRDADAAIELLESDAPIFVHFAVIEDHDN